MMSDNDVGDVLVELAALVADACLARAKCAEVLSRARVDVRSQLDCQTTGGFAVDRDIHEAFDALVQQTRLVHLLRVAVRLHDDLCRAERVCTGRSDRSG